MLCLVLELTYILKAKERVWKLNKTFNLIEMFHSNQKWNRPFSSEKNQAKRMHFNTKQISRRQMN